MGVNWKGDRTARFSDYIMGLTGELVSDVEDSMVNITKHGWARTKLHVETRGVESNPNPGRIDTGAMRDALGWEVSREGSEIHGRFGWIMPKSGKLPDARALFQDAGTTGGQGNGAGIPAMHALGDAFVQTVDDLKSRGLA